jgi:phage-related protein
MPAWSIIYYLDDDGHSPVEEFIRSLPKPAQASVLHDIDVLRDYGLQAPNVRPIEGRLWEIKSGAARVFYATYIGKRFVLLHGYYKKGPRAPRREIATAQRRMAAFMEADRT